MRGASSAEIFAEFPGLCACRLRGIVRELVHVLLLGRDQRILACGHAWFEINNVEEWGTFEQCKEVSRMRAAEVLVLNLDIVVSGCR